MRLTCPNCSAQYDIPEDMVPAEGREVQCSSCATVWYQPGPDVGEGAETGTGASPPSDRRPMADEATLDVLRQERAHEARLRAAERRRTRTLSHLHEPTEAQAAIAPEPARDAPRAAAAAERARMANAASVARARIPGERPADPPQAEPEADVPAAVPVVTDDVSEAIARTLREMSADRSPVGPDEDALAEQAKASTHDRAEVRRQARRNLLPDIEEINSSLRPDERALAAAAATEPEPDLELGEPTTEYRVDRRSGFGLGFTAVLILVGVGAAGYLFAGPLAEAVPQLASPLASYVAAIDAGRVALETWVDGLAEKILQGQ